MAQLTKNAFSVGQLIRKYRKEKGWTISEDPKRGISILHVVQERFGDATSPRLLKTETFKNFETSGPHHTDPTAIELYQIACVLEVPMLALMLDYDTPHIRPAFDPRQTIFQIAQSESESIQTFRGFEKIKNTEDKAREFVKYCKNLTKLPSTQIEDKLREDGLTKILWPRMDPAEVLSLNMLGFEASPATFEYYKEIQCLLHHAGISVFLPQENSIMAFECPAYVKAIQHQNYLQKEELKFIQESKLLKEGIKLLDEGNRKLLEQEYQEKCVKYLSDIGVDGDSINTIIANNNWDPNLLISSFTHNNESFETNNHHQSDNRDVK